MIAVFSANTQAAITKKIFALKPKDRIERSSAMLNWRMKN